MTVTPTQAVNRNLLIDALRGFALCWIFFANISGLTMARFKTLSGVEPSTWDHYTHILVDFLFVHKGYTLFSLLFGISFAIQMKRLKDKGEDQVSFYLKRMGILLLLGICHAHFVWNGDILILYALLGPLLLLYRKASNRTLIIWVICLLASQIPGTALLVLNYEPKPADPAQAELVKGILSGFADGTWSQWFASNFKVHLFKWIIYYTHNIRYPKVLAMFILGYMVGRSDFFTNLPHYLPQLRRWWPRLLVWGVASNVLLVYLDEHTSLLQLNGLSIVRSLVHFLAVTPFGLFLAVSFILAWQKPGFNRLLSPLANVGKLSLSNYVGQNALYTVLFCGWGLGLFHHLNYTLSVAMAPLVLLLQVALSRVWVAHFRFGPLEWVWRMLTYGRFIPLRQSH